jgi:hypothetical protein
MEIEDQIKNFCSLANSVEDEYEDDDIKKNEQELKNKYQELVNKNYSNLIKMRESFANKIFYFICVYSIFVGIILFFEGGHFGCDKIDWDTNVIITLITTTLAQVFGLMFIVLHYVFPNRN